ncbi:hypothetical protein PVAND_005134 [Polypedilum vanderplanki]|uniref:Reverse transcriptase domain-containing protein n=1 Tax=Polypedilum vanderplanki TaxID=319348 RepID=A0A9J6BZP0_POLVA|nr:hypothetical protein PVAND_005134 [Polypedilum vanderplanki]
MKRLGFRGKILNLIKDYLADRKQFVKINDYESDLITIQFGVPQGSNLGPLLFVIMLSDLQFINLHATIIEFADDILLIWIDSQGGIAEMIESDLKEINKYYDNNGLIINSDKSKYMIVGKADASNVGSKFDQYGYQQVNELKYLGVIIDDKISIKTQHQNIVYKLTNSLRAIKIIRNFLPTTSVWQFFNAFLSSHIYYCSFMLIRLPIKMIKRLQSLQSRGIKSVYKLDHQYPTFELFKRYAPNTLPVLGIIYLSILTLLKKALNEPGDAFGRFELIAEGRRKNRLIMKRFKTNILKHDSTYIGPKLYNQLPQDVRDTFDIKAFQRKVKHLLIRNIEIILDERNFQSNRIVA